MDFKTLNKQRASLKAKLTQFKTYLDAVSACSQLSTLQINELNFRLAKIEDLYSDYDRVQTDIENITEIPDDQYQEREAFETKYFGVVALAREVAARSEPPARADSDSRSVAGSCVHPELQQRQKWSKDGGQLTLGEMVLVKDDRLPPNQWLLGRVTRLYPGTDGITRVADILTVSGTLRRAFNRLCPLPVEDQNCTPGGQHVDA
ncbi:uncharacterized protein [Choristoneura fumiferana]|uniref:uncharacterized protein n=1 Tax=Choristoneura fumiferana TaxID=7141 RepID=UPI003D159452